MKISKTKKYKTFYGLPHNVEFCSKCVISNQRPSSSIEFKNVIKEKKNIIQFDESKICSACKYNEIKKKIDWKLRETKLKKLVSRFKRKSGYDCVVPGSGGKDSAYTAHILKYKYGLNPLTVTWSPHLYTDIGWKNFQSWIHSGGFDNILFTPNGKLHRILTKLSFENLLHPFQPFIVGQRIIGPLIAAKFDIPLVFYGENQAEYGNNIKENRSEKMKKEFFSVKNSKDIFLGGVQIKNIIKKYNFNIKDFEPYLPLDDRIIKKKKIEVHYLGYYLKWDPQECYYYAVENTNFQANNERTEGTYSKYSSIDDKIDMFHYFTTLIKFGIGRATYDAAQEIRNEKITREEGAKLVDLYDEEFPKKYFKDFLKYVSIDEKRFFQIIDKFRSPHIWGKDNSRTWKLRHTVSKDGLND